MWQFWKRERANCFWTWVNCMLGALIAFGYWKEALLWFNVCLSCSFIAGFLVLSSKAYDLYHPKHFLLTIKRSNSWGSSASLVQTWKMPIKFLFEHVWAELCSVPNVGSFRPEERQAPSWSLLLTISPPSALQLSSPLPSPVPDPEAQRHQHFSGRWLWKREGLQKNLWGFSLFSFSETPTIQLKFSKTIQLSEPIQNWNCG